MGECGHGSALTTQTCVPTLQKFFGSHITGFDQDICIRLERRAEEGWVVDLPANAPASAPAARATSWLPFSDSDLEYLDWTSALAVI